MADTVNQVTDRLRGSRRVIIYSKADRNATELKEMYQTADEIIQLDNIGREGETYLVSQPVRNPPISHGETWTLTLTRFELDIY